MSFLVLSGYIFFMLPITFLPETDVVLAFGPAQCGPEITCRTCQRMADDIRVAPLI